MLQNLLDRRVERVEAVQRERLGRPEAPSGRDIGAVMAQDAVRERDEALGRQLGDAGGAVA